MKSLKKKKKNNETKTMKNDAKGEETTIKNDEKEGKQQ